MIHSIGGYEQGGGTSERCFVGQPHASTRPLLDALSNATGLERLVCAVIEEIYLSPFSTKTARIVLEQTSHTTRIQINMTFSVTQQPAASNLEKHPITLRSRFRRIVRNFTPS